jgi:hypothetical protein
MMEGELLDEFAQELRLAERNDRLADLEED